MTKPKPLTPRQAWTDISLMVALVLLSALGVANLLVLWLEQLHLPAVLALQGLLILLALRLLLWYRGEGWGDIRLQALQLVDLPRGLLALLMCFGANLVFTSVLFVINGEPLSEHLETLRLVARQLQAGVSYAGLVGMMLFVGIYEEMVARGFLLSRSRDALGGIWGPVLVSSVLFGLGHVYQGWVGVAQTTLIGVILAGLTLHWGTLWPAILAHAGLNTLSLTLIRLIPESAAG